MGPLALLLLAFSVDQLGLGHCFAGPMFGVRHLVGAKPAAEAADVFVWSRFVE
jgi:hypothetical protein